MGNCYRIFCREKLILCYENEKSWIDAADQGIKLAKYYVKALKYNKKFGGFDIEQLVRIKDPLKLKGREMKSMFTDRNHLYTKEDLENIW